MSKTIYPECFAKISDINDFEYYLEQHCGFDKYDLIAVMYIYDDYLRASKMRELSDYYRDKAYGVEEHFQYLCTDVLDELDTLKEYTFEKTLTAKKKDEMRDIINRIVKMVDESFK